ncbi:glycerol kinase [archaeon]|nr:MAG: glycerol kinase [archaeon]
MAHTDERHIIAAIDQGTTSTRVLLFGTEPRLCVLASASKEFPQYFPVTGHVEHDPEEIWASVVECLATAMEKARVAPEQIASLGITNQRETVVAWNVRSGKAYGNAIVWQDGRGVGACQAKAAEHEKGIFRYADKTGLPLVPYFSASKLAWMLEHIPGLRKDAEEGIAVAGTIDAYLVWRLSGQHVTDITNASRTLLANIHTGAWDPELCADWNVPMRMLPRILCSVGNFGVCGPHSPLPGVMIGGVLGDQQAALFGQACFHAGDMKNTYGTGCFLLMNTGTSAVQSKHGLLTTVAYQLPNAPPVYALEGSVAIAGAAVTWLRDGLHCIDSAKEVEVLANSVPDSDGVTFVPAFNGLLAPHWRADARGLLIGLTRGTTVAHVARATLEAVACQSKDVLDAMMADARHVLPTLAEDIAHRPLRVDGGMSVNNLMLQIQADVLQGTVVRQVITETTALGAAFAAGLACGRWTSLEELSHMWEAEATWAPSQTPVQMQRILAPWKAAVQRSIGWSPLSADAASHAATAADGGGGTTSLGSTAEMVMRIAVTVAATGIALLTFRELFAATRSLLRK